MAMRRPASTAPRRNSDSDDEGAPRRFAIKPSTRRVLSALIDAHVYGLTAVQLAHPSIGGLDFRKRVSELRKEGFVVYSDRIEGRPYNRYRLEGRSL